MEPIVETDNDKVQNKGCIITFLSWGLRQIILVILGILMASMAFLNLFYSSTIIESCGHTHSSIFEVNVDVTMLTQIEDQLPFGAKPLLFTEPPTEVDEHLIATLWPSCLQYYGFAESNGDFRMNSFGQHEFFQTTIDSKDVIVIPSADSSVSKWSMKFVDEDFGLESLDEEGENIIISEIPVDVSTQIDLSLLGIIVLYLVVPGLVILIPIFTILTLRNTGIHWWVIMVILIASQSLTTSLVYIQFADVSGISTLQEFGIGIFTGIVTGTALTFMSKVVDRFGE